MRSITSAASSHSRHELAGGHGSQPPDDPVSFQIRVGPDAAPLLEYILTDAQVEWRDLIRGDISATAVIDTSSAQLAPSGNDSAPISPSSRGSRPPTLPLQWVSRFPVRNRNSPFAR
jgi:hypothetical protein